jgi:hypothetical protein
MRYIVTRRVIGTGQILSEDSYSTLEQAISEAKKPYRVRFEISVVVNDDNGKEWLSDTTGGAGE